MMTPGDQDWPLLGDHRLDRLLRPPKPPPPPPDLDPTWYGKHRPIREDEDFPATPSDEEIRQDMIALLTKLNDRQASVIHALLTGNSQPEISTSLDIPLRTLKRDLQVARSVLTRLLDH